jgi:hypothetical protein
MNAWIDQLAEALGVEALSERETEELLSVARDVAHRVERRITPLSTFLLGAAIGRSIADRPRRPDDLQSVVATVNSLLPESGPEEP